MIDLKIDGCKIIENNPDEAYFEIHIKADSNDGDYIKTTSKLDVNIFKDSGIQALKLLTSKYSGRHALENIAEEDLWIDDVLDMPYSDYGICHTLSEIQVALYDTDGKNYKVTLDSN